jgi:cytochrome P450
MKTIPPVSLRSQPSVLFEVLKNPSAFLLKLSSLAGDIGAFDSNIGIRIICVNRPDLIHQVLVEKHRSFRKMPAVKTLRAFTGDGLLVNDGDLWAKHRKLAAPAFHRQKIADYQRIVANVIGDAIQNWRDGEVIDLEREFRKITLRIIGRALFTADLDDIASGFSRDIGVALSYVNRLSGLGLLPFAEKFFRNSKGKAAIRRVDEIVMKIIHERRKKASGSSDLLDMLIQTKTIDGESLSDEEIRDEAITMFVAGHETVSTVLTWTYHLLARHSQIESRLRTEAETAFNGALPNFESLPNLPLALQTYKESMRLQPSAFIIGRQAVEEVVLGEYGVPKNSWVMVCVYTAHRNPHVFAQPDRFCPERFESDNEKMIPKGAYLPFGLGARMCIGSQFALMEGQTIIGAMAKNLRLIELSSEPVGVSPMITLNPDRKILMRVKKL